jgi:hypothetical protein
MRRIVLLFCITTLSIGCGSDEEAAPDKATQVAVKVGAASTKDSAKVAAAKTSVAVAKGVAVKTVSADPVKAVKAVSGHTVTTLTVTVNPKKENGKAWDAFGGKPDIAICVTDAGKMTCYPSGDSLKKVKKPLCKNALSCTVEEVRISGKTIKVDIVDTDAADNDLIGSGECTANGRGCTVGQATVNVRRPQPNKAARAVAASARSAERAEKRAAAEKMANPDRPDYPVRCEGLDMKHHTKIKGAARDLCVPNNLYDLAKAGVFEHKFRGAPSGYTDKSEFAILGKPQKKAGEKSRLSNKERSTLAKQTRSNIYWTANRSCSLDFHETLGKLSGSCDWSDIYVSGSPRVKKKVKCETMGTTCPGRCSDHDDCSGWTCGCDRSRCRFGRCTRCPSERICDDPEFTEKGIKPWTFSVTYKTDAEKAVAKAMVDSWKKEGILFFKVKSHFRKVFYGKEDGETIVQHDSGYKLKIQPLALVYRNQKTGDLLNVYTKGKLQTTFDKRWKRNGSRTSSASVNPVSKISCSKGKCTAKTTSAKK